MQWQADAAGDRQHLVAVLQTTASGGNSNVTEEKQIDEGKCVRNHSSTAMG
jgi:hypothetical protein